MKRIPIRLRLTLPFALAMALVLAALGLFVYLRVGSALLASVDQRLRGEAADLGARGGGEVRLLDTDRQGGAQRAELLDVEGRVVRSSPAGLRGFLGAPDVARVLAGATIVRSVHLPGLDGEWRLRAQRISGAGDARILALAATLEPREASLEGLFREFALAGPVALLLAGLAGYGLAAAALRPVEAMRRRAAAISASTLGSRLPVPPGRDELVRLATTLNEMIDRLEAAFAHERSFVADASHELRTPLALLRTELDVALRRPRSRDELERALRSAAEETERLTRLAEDLLLIARADHGELPVRRAPLEVSSALEAAAERFRPRARADGRWIEVAMLHPDLVADADGARLGQALDNLLENALVHGAGTVRLVAREAEATVEVHVTDEGPGLDPDFAARAFDRFSQADPSRGGGGSGLGLAIVDLIARAHGGEAHVGRADTGGADVWLTIRPVRFS
jgi:two-component system, OmpR family, sensor kinase